ncbi:hypothetical protein GGS20DRAFT_588259 [Poronia punctata]|nr:hypothetical protein GGS20DRAFT_588259 [Poronia punctata]
MSLRVVARLTTTSVNTVGPLVQDYDCFYASVFENEHPCLKSQPLGVKQKSILATCNYVARARGVKKLMLITEAQKLCPDLVLMNGEDLTRFRNASKRLWSFLRAHSWNGRVERLGLDEVFLDVTDVVGYNRELLNTHALADSFFQLDRSDPVKGFAFDGSRFYGHVEPPPSQAEDADTAGSGGFNVDVSNETAGHVTLMLASHLAGYLRHKLDEDFGYTSSVGISTSKLLAKLAGTVHKPNDQTTLLTAVDGALEVFMDAHSLRKVPGVGSRTVQAIEEHMFSHLTTRRNREGGVTVGEVRRYQGLSPGLLNSILDRPGAERGGGEKIWNLIHGVDASEVKEASDVPTQISIEDTYMSRPLQSPAEVGRELRALATSLLRRMRVDLTDANVYDDAIQQPAVHRVAETCPSQRTPRWLAFPKTLRLSTRTKPKSNTNVNESSTFGRSSRSAPLPNFVFNISPSPPCAAPTPTASQSHAPFKAHPCSQGSLLPPAEELAERLVTESLLPLFRRLHPERGGWNLALLNICVTNMVAVAVDTDNPRGKGTVGRDIGSMFRTQVDTLRQWTLYDEPQPPSSCPMLTPQDGPTASVLDNEDALYGTPTVELIGESEIETEETAGEEGYDNIWGEIDASDSQRCTRCGHVIPVFALSAHDRFHALGE